jgi:hypothetical protein
MCACLLHGVFGGGRRGAVLVTYAITPSCYLTATEEPIDRAAELIAQLMIVPHA